MLWNGILIKLVLLVLSLQKTCGYAFGRSHSYPLFGFHMVKQSSTRTLAEIARQEGSNFRPSISEASPAAFKPSYGPPSKQRAKNFLSHKIYPYKHSSEEVQRNPHGHLHHHPDKPSPLGKNPDHQLYKPNLDAQYHYVSTTGKYSNQAEVHHKSKPLAPTVIYRNKETTPVYRTILNSPVLNPGKTSASPAHNSLPPMQVIKTPDQEYKARLPQAHPTSPNVHHLKQPNYYLHNPKSIVLSSRPPRPATEKPPLKENVRVIFIKAPGLVKDEGKLLPFASWTSGNLLNSSPNWPSSTVSPTLDQWSKPKSFHQQIIPTHKKSHLTTPSIEIFPAQSIFPSPNWSSSPITKLSHNHNNLFPSTNSDLKGILTTTTSTNHAHPWSYSTRTDAVYKTKPVLIQNLKSPAVDKNSGKILHPKWDPVNKLGSGIAPLSKGFMLTYAPTFAPYNSTSSLQSLSAFGIQEPSQSNELVTRSTSSSEEDSKNKSQKQRPKRIRLKLNSAERKIRGESSSSSSSEENFGSDRTTIVPRRKKHKGGRRNKGSRKQKSRSKSRVFDREHLYAEPEELVSSSEESKSSQSSSEEWNQSKNYMSKKFSSKESTNGGGSKKTRQNKRSEEQTNSYYSVEDEKYERSRRRKPKQSNNVTNDTAISKHSYSEDEYMSNRESGRKRISKKQLEGQRQGLSNSKRPESKEMVESVSKNSKFHVIPTYLTSSKPRGKILAKTKSEVIMSSDSKEEVMGSSEEAELERAKAKLLGIKYPSNSDKTGKDEEENKNSSSGQISSQESLSQSDSLSEEDWSYEMSQESRSNSKESVGKFDQSEGPFGLPFQDILKEDIIKKFKQVSAKASETYRETSSKESNTGIRSSSEESISTSSSEERSKAPLRSTSRNRKRTRNSSEELNKSKERNRSEEKISKKSRAKENSKSRKSRRRKHRRKGRRIKASLARELVSKGSTRVMKVRKPSDHGNKGRESSKNSRKRQRSTSG